MKATDNKLLDLLTLQKQYVIQFISENIVGMKIIAKNYGMTYLVWQIILTSQVILLDL